MGSRIGNVVYSSAIGGRVPGGGGELTDDLDKQAETMFENMKAFMELAGNDDSLSHRLPTAIAVQVGDLAPPRPAYHATKRGPEGVLEVIDLLIDSVA